LINRFWYIFAVYFFFTSVGLLFDTHTCGKKVNNSVWGISVSGSNACACKHENENHRKKCCSHDSKWLKADTGDSKLSVSQVLQKSFSALFISGGYHAFNISMPAPVEEPFSISHPPPLNSLPVYIRHRALLI
jgi:hypothetical protein